MTTRPLPRHVIILLLWEGSKYGSQSQSTTMENKLTSILLRMRLPNEIDIRTTYTTGWGLDAIFYMYMCVCVCARVY